MEGKMATCNRNRAKKNRTMGSKALSISYHTFWPWTTGIEMLARSRFNKVEGCNILLTKLASEGHPHIHAFYEWINPITDQASGSYPFRTGITSIRIAIADILEKINNNPSSPSVR